jgi:hypothetical protein
MTTLVDVSNKFVCKPRWKSPAASILESVGVLDVYFTGKANAVWIADNILVVEAYFTAGRTVVFGSDIQDLCTLGWAVGSANPTTAYLPDYHITKPDGTTHWIWQQGAFGPLGPGTYYTSCERLALAERNVLGIPLATGQDPLAP